MSYRGFTVATSRGDARLHVVKADLRGAGAGLLYPGAVADRAPVSKMARDQGAVAAVNGDFFHIAETQHPGVPVTGAPSGPAMVGGRPLKAAVPHGQRFGRTPPPGDSVENVVGVGRDGKARTARLTMEGHVHTGRGEIPLGGLNQYALPVGSVGVFTSQWGTASRARAVCGSDSSRAAPCTADAYEVTIRDGLVVSGSSTPGTGAIDADTQVLLGREAGAQALRRLLPGQSAHVSYGLASTTSVPFRFALGAHFVLRGHRPVAGLDRRTAEPRTAIGIADGGNTVYLVATDGREGTSSGLTHHELATLMASLGCAEALYMDGGGSSTLVTRDAESGGVDVRNHLARNQERDVPNGIAIFSR
ncbi:phosphodiester glycosidase family protein [Streptomyces sp. NPDC003038]|uniref:phosphodiester glycosidase family protein n=1 Tax=unclassified Streptomyces TaxID=2593676 RepID=UPI0033B15672